MASSNILCRLRNCFKKPKYNLFSSRNVDRVIISIVINLTIYLQNNLSNAAALHDDRNNNNSAKDTCNEVCSTPVCVNQASMFLQNMDQNVDPCDDFYQFVCGNFQKRMKINNDESSINIFRIFHKKLRDQLVSEITGNVMPDDSTPTKKLKTFYQNCLNESNIELIGKQPYLEILKNLGGWPVLLGDAWKEDDYDWKETVSKASLLGLYEGFPFSLYVGTDFTNSKKNILTITPIGTMITKTYYAEGNENLKAYKAYMVDIAVMLGANPETAQKEMEECLKFEEELYKLKTPREDLLDISPVENQHTIGDLYNKYPGIDWLNIIQRMINMDNISLNKDVKIGISDPKFISGLENILKTIPKRVIANYQIWTIVDDLVMLMPKEFNDRQLIFQRIITGIKERPPRNLRCMSWTMSAFAVAVSANYVKKHFDPKTKEKVNEIVEAIRDQMKNNLEQVDWMDDITRKAALEKWKTLGSNIAYPDELLDDNKVEEYYKDLEIQPGNLLNNALSIDKFFKNIMFKRLNNPNHWTKKAAVAVVNAFYNVGKNEISLPAGILQNPFFNPNRPEFLNYGSLGFIVGHELIHGFDSNGRKFDKDSNYKNWWQNNTLEKFNEKSNCLINQYSNYSVSQINQKINGKLTLSENIADNGGIKLAYHAYENWIKRNNVKEPCLSGLSYTPKQMFWISAANTWCSKSRDEYLRDSINEDYHSPDRQRVTVTLSNMKEFATDFNCKIGSKMNPEKKCEVW